MNSLFIFGVFLAVSAAPTLGDNNIKVCRQEDESLRIDCNIPPKPNQVSSYSFSMTKAGKETPITNNFTGGTTDLKFKDKIRVVPLENSGFRLTMTSFQLTENTTFICKVQSVIATAQVEKGKLVTCSAINAFLHSCPWLLYALLALQVIRSWGLPSL
ncbi:uncharacterized protein [Lepisosteus oculatus]